MDGNKEGIFTFGKAERQLSSQLVRLFRRNFARFGGLPDLIGNHLMPLPMTGDLLILVFGQQELLIYSHRIALIPGDQFPPCLSSPGSLHNQSGRLGSAQAFFLYSHAWGSVAWLP